MEIGIKVGDIMTRNFIFSNPGVSVLNAVKLMKKNRVGSLVISENNHLKGILTEKDILWALSKKKDLTGIKIGDIMKRKITTIKPSADIYKALSVMKKTKFRRLPVIVNKKVIGLLTLKDILRIEPELFEIVKENYVIKEQEMKIKRKTNPAEFQEGICEECGNVDILYNIDSKLICESCRDNL